MGNANKRKISPADAASAVRRAVVALYMTGHLDTPALDVLCELLHDLPLDLDLVFDEGVRKRDREVVGAFLGHVEQRRNGW